MQLPGRQSLSDGLVEVWNLFPQSPVARLAPNGLQPETRGNVLNEELLHFWVWWSHEPESTTVFGVDLGVGKVLHVRGGDLDQVITANVVGAHADEVGVGEASHCDDWPLTHAIAPTAREHPVDHHFVGAEAASVDRE